MLKTSQLLAQKNNSDKFSKNSVRLKVLRLTRILMERQFLLSFASKNQKTLLKLSKALMDTLSRISNFRFINMS